MYLLPQPTHLVQQDGQFLISTTTPLVLDATCDFDDLHAIGVLQDEIQASLGFNLAITKQFNAAAKSNAIVLTKANDYSAEGYALTVTPNTITIAASTGAGIFYGVQTLRQMIRQAGAVIPCLEIQDQPHFPHRGFYHDLTRGKVATLDTLKELVDRAAFYKLNQIQLYVEHTFAFEGLSEVWMDKDPITAEEILILDAYCKQKHVELVPSLSTFGHFYEILKSKSFRHLCELEVTDKEYSFVDRMAHHTLNTLEDGSFELVAKMLGQFIPLFSSDQFNICCDETFDLGRGKSKAKADEVGTGRLYVDFLNKIVSCVKSHNKKVMFWGDVILHHPELLDEIPEDVICLTWDYSSSCGDNSIRKISETGRPQYVCPGVGGWSQLMNLMWNAFENIRRMAAAGRDHGAIGVLNTDWGDYGHVNHFASSMPGMIYGAQVSWNPTTTDETDFTETYKAISTIEYGEKCETIVSLLHQLSGRQGACWSDVVRWKELQHNQHDEVEVISSWNVERVLNGYQTAIDVEKELVKLAGSVSRNHADIQEFITSARAIQLIDTFVLTLIKDKVGTAEAVPALNPAELACALEVWFTEFAAIWRNRNKESELYRIREVIAYLSRYLRDLNN